MDNLEREFEIWFEQAKFDLKAARDSLKSENYEWSCFQAQQAAEKALKAYLYLKGEELILTHSIFRLIKKCKDFDGAFRSIEHCRELDKYYIPTRYANGLPDVIPHEFYTKEDAAKCVEYAETVISTLERIVNI
ncbi:MAG: HEPN domain-containing protein [Thermoplasmata archaeon]